jgi:hypothetical protein
MDKLAELLRQGADKLVNLPTEAQRFVTNPQAFIQLLTGKNPLPKETGFAAGATGLPAQQGTVLDPNYQAYMQGYEQGEPVSYAAMATPAAVPVAKALAPKAGQMAEQYMVNQGFMPSLIAYHGTPHTIKGKFDISKVGTGEGAQAYGHGMYFAENPAVAKGYADKLGYDYQYAGKTPKEGSPTDFALRWLKNLNWDKEAAKAQWKNEGFGAKVIQAIDKIDLEKVKAPGNLYKVDIPDEYIPNMLDWDKPLSKQPTVLQNIKNLSERPDLPKGFDQAINRALEDKFFDGQDLYYELTKVYKDPVMLAKAMQESGFKGIKYLDEGSRNTALQPYYQLIRKSDGAVYTQMQDLKKAENFVKDAKNKGVEFEISAPIDKRTSNFVVFDPTDVKILEQNSKPMTRKEIIEQELEKVAK